MTVDDAIDALYGTTAGWETRRADGGGGERAKTRMCGVSADRIVESTVARNAGRPRRVVDRLLDLIERVNDPHRLRRRRDAPLRGLRRGCRPRSDRASRAPTY